MIVTIDGPAGTGKSTVAKRLADQLGFEFLNTGAMYRAVAYACLRHEVNLADDVSVEETARGLQIVFSNNRLLLGGVDVSDAIRTQSVTQSVPIVAAIPAVRRQLVQLQQMVGRTSNLVTEGRDQGTDVFPNAECKFFLTASPRERARRRQLELENKGESISLEELLKQQQDRDRLDESRACSPLQPATDALVVDTTEMSLDEVTSHLELIAKRIFNLGNI